MWTVIEKYDRELAELSLYPLHITGILQATYKVPLHGMSNANGWHFLLMSHLCT